jgi:hypothetical protein
MNQLALRHTVNGDADPQSYGALPNKKETWDYDMMYGCHCDEGWEGYDCSLQQCPRGDDPTTVYHDKVLDIYQSNEVQEFDCEDTDTPSSTVKTFKLQFRQHMTVAIESVDNEETLKAKLEALDSIGTVVVEYSETGHAACPIGATNVITIRFRTENGDLPLMTLHEAESGLAMSATVTETVPGTTEDDVCSGRGLCNRSTGLCQCFPGWGSSDGAGARGNEGDCGYREPYVPVTDQYYTGTAAEAGDARFSITG